MEDNFSIYIGRLREGHEETIDFSVESTFIGIPEEFQKPVQVTGVAYRTDRDLVLRLNIASTASLACHICNELCEFKITILNHYHVVELAKISTSVFNFEDLVRDTLLLHLPHFVECNEGTCPEREELARYFSKKNSS